MKDTMRAYATGCRYCDNWGPISGCWRCVRRHPLRLIRKLVVRIRKVEN